MISGDQTDGSNHLHENIDMKLTWCSVRGMDMIIPMMVVITENTAVHSE